MIDLNNLDEIKILDPRNTLGATDLMLKQCEAAWQEVTTLDLPHHIEGIKNIVFCGMGASIYGALVLKALKGPNMPLPTEIVSDYFLPEYVGSDTLVVLTSYSGSTEEVLSCAEDAKAKGAKMIVLTKGGKLAEFAKENDLPAYIFDGKLNLSGAPRVGCGYTIFGLIGLLSKLNIVEVEEQEIANALTRMHDKFNEIKNQAKKDVILFKNKIPIIFAAEHLSGNAQILRNQFNETSKAFSSYFLIPDLNHHLMEGLQFPENAPLYFIVLNSPNFSEKIKKRTELTTALVKKNKYQVHNFMTTGASVFDDFIETLIYGSYLTLYLGLTYNQNPAINPYVDWFKEQLAK
ncbi:MAG TPA: SIS domain-containing protein [Patescibacteria group bacterium]